jgi:hypothetical protein
MERREKEEAVFIYFFATGLDWTGPNFWWWWTVGGRRETRKKGDGCQVPEA